eukprot:gb/GECG01010293.1/.p1 GENE.gb/GECG01010293.1/~~gb/GECG01010293.1/.p1  ORF type:complete len:1392 (+),score=178.89 gb/GECG01010293.1/:1-4176(+)
MEYYTPYPSSSSSSQAMGGMGRAQFVEQYQLQFPSFPSLLSFDTHEQALWMADRDGWIHGYGVPGFDADPYARFRAHETASCCLNSFSSGVISVNPGELKLFTRGGCILKTISAQALSMELGAEESASETPRCLRAAMEVTDSPYQSGGSCKIIIGGKMKAAHVIDLNQQSSDRIKDSLTPLVSVPIPHDVHCIDSSSAPGKSLVCLGSGSDGQVSLLDGKMRSPHPIGTFNFHGGGCSDISVSQDGRYIITCGNLPQSSSDDLQMGIAGKPRKKALPDPCLKVFDVRNQRFLPPVNTGSGVPASACFVRFVPSPHPKDERSIIVGTRSGRMWYGSFHSLKGGVLPPEGYTPLTLASSQQLAPIGGATSLSSSGCLAATIDTSGLGHILSTELLEKAVVGPSVDPTGVPLAIPLKGRHGFHLTGCAWNGMNPDSTLNSVHPILACGEARYRPVESEIRSYARLADDPNCISLQNYDYPVSMVSKDVDGAILTYGRSGVDVNPELMEYATSSSFLQNEMANENVQKAYGEDVARITYIKNPGMRPNSFYYSKGITNRGLAARYCLQDNDPRQANKGFSDDGHRKQARAALQTLFSQGRSSNMSEDITIESSSSPVSKSETPRDESVPDLYRQPKLQYSRVGLSNFDFSDFNSTEFSGLEDIGPNSVINPLCQTLFFQSVFRRFIRRHLSSHPKCLTTELRFLYDMLSSSWKMRSDSRSCRAVNFMRTLQHMPEAKQLGILYPSSLNCSKRVMGLTKVLLEKMQKDGSQALKPHPNAVLTTSNFASSVSLVEDLFYLQFSGFTTFEHDRERTTEHRQSSVPLLEIVYPRHQPYAFATDEEFQQNYSFSALLKNSLHFVQRTRAWSEELGANAPMLRTKIVKRLPPVLIVSSNLDRTHDWQRHLWSHEDSASGDMWLPSAVDIKLSSASADDLVITHPTVNADPDRAVYNVPQPPWDSSEARRRYRLVAVVSNVSTTESGDDGESHYVANVLVSKSGKYGSGAEEGDRWLVFNDFQVRQTTETDTKNFGNHRDWRTPCVCVYQDMTLFTGKDSPTGIRSIDELAADVSHDINNEPHFPVPLSAFAIPPLKQARASEEKVVLPHMELPFGKGNTISDEKIRQTVRNNLFSQDQEVHWISLQKGDEVALDAEFVAASTDVAKLQSDGSRVVSEEARLLPARLSIIYNDHVPPELSEDSPVLPSQLTRKVDTDATQEELAEKGLVPRRNVGDVLLDDYIAPMEPVVDHLTRFSGIVADDLNPVSSDKRLALYKSVYLKLRALVDAGVRFIGHGLAKDFRTLNIWLPEEQIIDTVHLYRQPRQRIMSLRWLAAYVLGEAIQSDTHDSVEDARTALRLVLRYRQLEAKDQTISGNNSVIQKVITELYGIGRAKGWKIRG